MCGIFGLIIKHGVSFPSKKISCSLKNIAILSESRGKDSSGIAFRFEMDRSIQVIKGDVPIRQLLNSQSYKKVLRTNFSSYEKKYGFAAFGHARLVTNGSQLQEENNQPVLKDGIIIIHNGIIVNADKLWEQHSDLNREYLIDTEIIPALIRKELKQQNDLRKACSKTFNQLVGTYSVAMMFQDLNQIILATNNGSLYYVTDNSNFILFGSERHYLNEVRRKASFRVFGKNLEIEQIQADYGLIVDMSSFVLSHFCTKQSEQASTEICFTDPYQIKKQILENNESKNEIVIDPSSYIIRSKESHLFDLLEYNIESIKSLKRCSKCLLPETFPFIIYDNEGVCNYCNNYKRKIHTKGFDELRAIVEPYRKANKAPDCIVPFSGGRDSTYSLHVIKKELDLNPIAFTYDWGMVTDLARRNIARVCGKLGVENVIVSADIRWKRENIRKNIISWLRNPDLGMVPLFMAGDKYFFYYCNKVKKQMGIDLNIWGINPLENTEFKTGFAGLAPKFEKERIYSLSIKNQVKLFGFVAGNILKSPGYINQSVIDSLGSFAVRYISPKRDYYHLFDYYRWDEDEINNIISNEYNWETAIDTKSTWRIGDGTASFYNYIYYTVAGFSENDTFRSNQIREGMLSREQAMKLLEEDNFPRYETLRWYLEIIGIDFVEVIKTVNRIPKLYPL